MTARPQFAALIAAAILVALGFLALHRAAPHGQGGIELLPASSADTPAAGAASSQPSKPSEMAGSSAEVTGDVGDLLEPMAAQLADLMEHLKEQCGAVSRAAGAPSLSAVTRCVDAGAAAASTIEFVRGTLASAAGRDVSTAVRSRWMRDLDAATAEIRTSLTPIQEWVNQALTSEALSPAAFREMGHLRDRIDRVLADLNS
jgi:hypothetical protein